LKKRKITQTAEGSNQNSSQNFKENSVHQNEGSNHHQNVTNEKKQTPSAVNSRAQEISKQRRDSRTLQIKNRNIAKQNASESSHNKLSGKDRPKPKISEEAAKAKKRKVIDWDKIHAKQFARMDDLDVFLHKKEQRHFAFEPNHDLTQSTDHQVPSAVVSSLSVPVSSSVQLNSTSEKKMNPTTEKIMNSTSEKIMIPKTPSAIATSHATPAYSNVLKARPSSTKTEQKNSQVRTPNLVGKKTPLRTVTNITNGIHSKSNTTATKMPNDLKKRIVTPSLKLQKEPHFSAKETPLEGKSKRNYTAKKFDDEISVLSVSNPTVL